MSHTLKISEAGEMHIITLGGMISYHIFTKAGYFRGGKRYFSDKIFRVLSGEVEFIYETLGGDISQILIPANGEKVISAGTAHIFKARTDCVFFESFPEDTESEEYERYRAMKM